MPIFEVAVVSREQRNYYVEAESAEKAEELMELKWSDDLPDEHAHRVKEAMLGNEWSEIQKIAVRPFSP